jgi:hypothetical protein
MYAPTGTCLTYGETSSPALPLRLLDIASGYRIRERNRANLPRLYYAPAFATHVRRLRDRLLPGTYAAHVLRSPAIFNA